MKPGSYVRHPAGAHHFDGAKDEEVILQIVGYGPSGTTRLRPDEGRFGDVARAVTSRNGARPRRAQIASRAGRRPCHA